MVDLVKSTVLPVEGQHEQLEQLVDVMFKRGAVGDR